MTPRMLDLARQYREAARDLHCAAQAFAQASDLLEAGKLAQAEASVRKGIEACGKAVEGIPQIAEEKAVA